MKRFWGFLLTILLALPAMAEELPLSPVCWPLHFAGITLGVNTDPEVQRLLGNGVYRKVEGDAGGRYFVDPEHTATLHILSFTDAIVGELTLQEGIAVNPEEISAATSRWFDPQKGFGNWHALHLGSTRDEVKKNLGVPVKGGSTDEWRYDSKCACELPVFFTIHFRNDRIWKVVFEAPPG